MGPLRGTTSDVAATGPLVLDLASDLLRLSRCSPVCRLPARPGCGFRAGLCSQSRPDLRVGAVARTPQPSLPAFAFNLSLHVPMAPVAGSLVPENYGKAAS